MATVKATFKATTDRSYFARVEEAIFDGLEDAVDRVLALGVRVAKKHAPERKVTKVGRGHGARTRELDSAEIAALPDFVKRGLNPVTGAFIKTGALPRTTLRRSAASHDRPIIKSSTGQRKQTISTAREVRETTDDEWRKTGNVYALRHTAMESVLTAEGRRGLRTGVGVSTDRSGYMEPGGRIRGSVRATLGGRLRREIRADFLGADNGVVKGILLSPTEYARYVEFPTSRTAAQPYMRPARAAMDARLVPEVEAAISRASRVAGGG